MLHTTSTIRVGTRGSALALWQAETVKSTLLVQNPSLNVVIQVIKTSGDIDLSTPLSTLPFTGYFTKELEHALVRAEIDIAVHSLKDMAVKTVEPFALAAVLPRGPVEDALVLNPKYDSLDDLPAKPLILTGSVRRRRQLGNLFDDFTVEEVRGNIQTRIRKVTDLNADALVLAKAVLVRLGIRDQKIVDLSIKEMIPAPGQGAVGIECLAAKSDLLTLLKSFDDPVTRRAVDVERHITSILEGGCTLPLGVHAAPVGENLNVTVGFFPEYRENAQFVEKTILADEDAIGAAAAIAAEINTSK